MRRFLPALALAVAALVSCARSEGPGGGASGIRGRVIAFPNCVMTETSPCPSKPVATTVVVESETGEFVRVESASDGAFRVALPAGSYLVSAQPPPGSDLVPRPHQVTVVDGGYRRVTVILDSRLREP
ncbi:MAG: hypothetical protein ACRDKA_10565 [Actinomycetota bacterium]